MSWFLYILLGEGPGSQPSPGHGNFFIQMVV